MANIHELINKHYLSKPVWSVSLFRAIFAILVFKVFFTTIMHSFWVTAPFYGVNLESYHKCFIVEDPSHLNSDLD